MGLDVLGVGERHRPEHLGLQRYLVQLTVGPTPHDNVMRAIELLGTEVAPVVRRETVVTGPGIDHRGTETQRKGTP